MYQLLKCQYLYFSKAWSFIWGVFFTVIILNYFRKKATS